MTSIKKTLVPLSTAVALVTLVGAADAAKSGPEACAEKRLKLISVAAKDIAKCAGRGEVSPNGTACQTRAAAKLEKTWSKNDNRYECAMEEKGLAGGVSTLLEDWIQDVMSAPDWGIVIPDPDLTGHFGKRVFFAPFCDLDPRDYPDAYAYYDAVNQEGCFPDLLAEYTVVDSNWSNLYQLVSFTGSRELSFNKAGHHCAQIANSAGLGQFESAHFDVWMSNEHTDPASRFERSEIPYVLPSGATVAHDWEDLTDTEIRHEINETAFGQIVSAKRVATGTKPDGTRQDGDPFGYDLHLVNWTNFNSVPEGTDDAFRHLAPGNTSKTVGQWSQAAQEIKFFWGASSMGLFDRPVDGVYCFEQ